jgi:sugar phosphate isomerase/epimerase
MSVPPLGLGHFTFLDHDPAALGALAAEAGYGFVGLRFQPVAQGHIHYCPRSEGEAAALRHRLAEIGVGIYDIEAFILDESADVDDFKAVIGAARAVGAQRLNASADDWDRGAIADKFAAFCALAGDAGLAVDLEPMAWRGIDTPEKCIKLIEASGAANAFYLADTLHHFRCGGTVGQFEGELHARVQSAQLCDAPAQAPDTMDARLVEARGGRLPLGEGGLDVAGFIGALPDDTVCSVELPMAGDRRPPLQRAQDIRQAALTFFGGYQ